MALAGHRGVGDAEYRRRIRAWTMYDWANSAFATTILAAVLPIYYSRVAGETLPSESVATAYWTIGLSVALFVVAILSPLLGTISDLKRGKKPLLAVSIGAGVVATGLVVLVGSGDWMLASLLFVLGRIGFGAANVFYDALLPHVARPEDQDRVSALGYAVGYVGGGILLAINAAMIFLLGEVPGSRLSFLSVALWWAVFSIPVLRRVPEPPAAAAEARSEGAVIRASVARLRETFGHLRRYRELLRFLVAFLIYNDGIGTIIGVAAIYGAELGFGTEELILALLLVQFVGIPFTLVFGRIPGGDPNRRRRLFVGFVLINLVALPVVGALGARTLGADVVGRRGADFEATATAVGQDSHGIETFDLEGDWAVAPEGALGSGARSDYAFTGRPGDRLALRYNGQKVEITYSRGPDHGSFIVEIDGEIVLDDDEPLVVDGFNETERFEEREVVDAGTPGEHLLVITNHVERDADSTGSIIGVAEIEVLEPVRESNLGVILGLLLIVEAAALVLALVTSGTRLLDPLLRRLDTKHTIMLALAVYAVIAVWGFFLDAVIEFWFLAWMVAVVQGGSQALSRSLYASMSPTSMSGEFFGFFSIMAKFSAILGPAIFAGAVALFGNSRPAVLGVVVFFVVGGLLLARVDVEEGRRVALAEDEAAAGGSAPS